MIKDDIGNKLYRKGDIIFLKLISESYSRKLGIVEEQSENFITNRVYAKHLYRNAKAFGFNSEFLRSATLFKNVKIITDRGETFVVPVDFILNNGDYLHFKKQGFERQIFIKLIQLEKIQIMSKFKPNLIDNEPKDGSFTKEDREAIMTKHGGMENYIVFPKKDGCRLEIGLEDRILSRSLKEPGSNLVKDRFEEFNRLCLSLNLIIEGEFYWHGEAFNHINRFFAKSDVTTPEYHKELTNMLTKKPEAFQDKFRGKDIEFLTTFHEDLKFWAFDFIITDRPELKTFEERWAVAVARLAPYDLPLFYVKMPEDLLIKTYDELDLAYQTALDEGYEGLVLIHKDHIYKYGRSRLKAGTIFKMKEDKEEYDGIVIGVEESTVVKDGVEKTINELGRSKTSKKKGDRVPSGMAKGFLVEYEGLGTFCVNLNGFDHEARKEVFDNQEKYIGRHFKYTGMKPVKDFPRHAYFDCWRDEK